MKLFNVLTRQVEAFAPQQSPVTVYVCGITPYDTTHLGHAFTYSAFDILIRYLEYRGNSVRYVENVTDIDDDILRKAREVGEDWQRLGNRWTRHFIRDMQALSIRPPDYYARATDFISGIIDAVRKLVETRVAYVSAGNVYFDINAWPTYGVLSKLSREEMLPIANERGNNPTDPHKRGPLDFVLWQAQAPGEPAWESPWGRGRPGWHIECSTMATRLLGNSVEIHGGGADLVFPHHESEIAQAEASTGHKPFVRFWMHTAMVRHAGEKMSKSLGNLVMVNDLLRRCTPDALRIYLANHHYREPWSFDEQELDMAGTIADRMRAAVQVAPVDGPVGGGKPIDGTAARQAFEAAMDEDLNTQGALTALAALSNEIHAAARGGKDVRAAQQSLRRLSQVFGLRLDSQAAEERVVAGWKVHLERFLDDALQKDDGAGSI